MMTPAIKPLDVLNQSSAQGKTENKKFSELTETERIELRTADGQTYKKLFKAEYGFEPEI